MVAADENNPRMAAYVDRYMGSLVGRGNVPTTGMSQKVIETGEPMLVPRVPFERLFEHTTPAAREWFDAHPLPMEIKTVGIVLVPMRARGVTVGTLQLLDWNLEAPLTEDDVVWQQAVADRLGFIVEHAQSHTASIARLDRLTAMRNVGLAVASSQDLRLTLEVILEQVTMRLQVDAADVLLLDETGAELYVAAAIGFRSLAMPDIKMPTPDDITETSRLSWSYDARTDPAWTAQFRRRALLAREGFQSYRAVSLMARGKLMGILEVFHRTHLDVDQEWLGFLDALGTSAAIAIYSAGLQDQVARFSAGSRTPAQRPDLSGVEWRIMAMVVEGATNREIAAVVHLSENTIKFHIRRLLDRLGAVNRTDLARKATQNKWL